jgi:hypothetical protein
MAAKARNGISLKENQRQWRRKWQSNQAASIESNVEEENGITKRKAAGETAAKWRHENGDVAKTMAGIGGCRRRLGAGRGENERRRKRKRKSWLISENGVGEMAENEMKESGMA